MTMLAHAWQHLTGQPALPLIPGLSETYVEDVRDVPWNEYATARGTRGRQLRSLLLDLAESDPRVACRAADQLTELLAPSRDEAAEASSPAIPFLVTVLEHATDAREEAILGVLHAVTQGTDAEDKADSTPREWGPKLPPSDEEEAAAEHPVWRRKLRLQLEHVAPRISPFRVHENPRVADLAEAILDDLGPLATERPRLH